MIVDRNTQDNKEDSMKTIQRNRTRHSILIPSTASYLSISVPPSVLRHWPYGYSIEELEQVREALEYFGHVLDRDGNK